MRLRSQILKSSGLKAVQIGLGVVSSLLLARWLGPAAFGQYSYAFAIAGTVAVLSLLGWPVIVSREVARSATTGEWQHLRGVLTASNRMVAWTACIAALVAVSIAAATSMAAGRQDGVTIALAALAVPFLAFADLRAAALRGLGKVLRGQMLDALVRPSLVVVLVVIAWATSSASPRLAMGLQLAAALATFVLGVMLLRRSVPAVAAGFTPAVDPAWRASLLPLAFVSGVQVLGMHAPLLLLGILAPAEDAGMYRVAAAISAQVAFATWPINAVYAPHIVKANIEGKLGQLRTLIRKGRWFGLAIAVPAVVAIVLLGRPGLPLLLGPGYEGAYVPMVVLACGQLMAAAAGPIGPVLSLTGNERRVATSTAVALAISIGLGALLVPAYGATGAAVASAVSLAVMRIMLFRYARDLLRTPPEREQEG